jgi:predicted transcriptional regulator
MIFDILRKSRTGQSKTRLIGKCNISHNFFMRYSKILVEHELLAYNDGLYSCTETGKRLLEDYAKLTQSLS